MMALDRQASVPDTVFLFYFPTCHFKYFAYVFQVQVRSLALRVLREILRNQSRRFEEYAELTMLRILEAHKDPAKEVFIRKTASPLC